MKKIKSQDDIIHSRELNLQAKKNVNSQLRLIIRQKKKSIATKPNKAAKLLIHPKSAVAKQNLSFNRKANKSLGNFQCKLNENTVKQKNKVMDFLENSYLKCNFDYVNAEEEEEIKFSYSEIEDCLIKKTMKVNKKFISEDEQGKEIIKTYPVEQSMTLPEDNSLISNRKSFENLRQSYKNPKDDSIIFSEPLETEEILHKNAIEYKKDEAEIAENLPLSVQSITNKNIKRNTELNAIDLKVCQFTTNLLAQKIPEKEFKPNVKIRLPKLQKHAVKIIKMESEIKKRSTSYHQDM